MLTQRAGEQPGQSGHFLTKSQRYATTFRAIHDERRTWRLVDVDATFNEDLFDVAVGEPVTQVSADHHHDHIRREPETGET